ncbi:unnamed protein product [Staurois parvus]|uniref:Uncharacterized protein n=1 Tax=Staurois parvus TaxID=386267 RepID=A0ABN9C1B2_9NEOB|nr:unnamed protein product [Staurois parvus]
MVWYSNVLLCDFSECHFLSFSNFPPFRPPYVPTLTGDGTHKTSARLHCRGHCRRDIVGAQDKVSDRGIPKQRRMVSPSVARGGYRFCYTREYHQGG